MVRYTLSQCAHAGRRLAPSVLLVGAYLCVSAWGFAFSPAGVPLLVLGSATVVAAMILRPTVRLLLAGVVVLCLAWGGLPWLIFWVNRAVSAL